MSFIYLCAYDMQYLYIILFSNLPSVTVHDLNWHETSCVPKIVTLFDIKNNSHLEYRNSVKK